MPGETSKRLGAEEAQEEANTARAAMGMSPETYKVDKPSKPDEERSYKEPVKMVEGEATPEDYEQALGELNELERLAKENPNVAKKLLQYAVMAAYTATTPVQILGAALKETMAKISGAEKLGAPSSERPKGYKKAFGEVFSSWSDIKNTVFSDARSKLERLKKSGAKFGKKETKE